MRQLQLPDIHHFSSIGNLVTVGVQLYRSNFKRFLKLAVIAHLWLLIPLYGWAKSYAIAALIGRLAFNDLTNQSEPIETLQKTFHQKKWRIFIINVSITLLICLVLILTYLAFAIVLAILTAIFSIAVLQRVLDEPADSVIPLTLGFVVLLVLFMTGIGFYSRYFIIELPMSVECNFKLGASFKRSRQLTQRSTMYVLGVLFSLFLLSFIPSFLFANLLGMTFFWSLIRWVLQALDVGFSTRMFIGYTIWIVFSLVASAFTMPLWQSAKAALYYSLRSRREGFDLTLMSDS